MPVRPALPMRLICLLALAALLACPALLAAGEEQAPPPPASRVEVSVVLPADLTGFHGGALVVTLYEYDPRLADAGATPQEQVVVRHLSHQEGVEQTLRFTIGDALQNPRPDRKYYLACRIYEDTGDEDSYAQGDQLHYCHNEHPNLPGTVYDEHNGNAAEFTAR